ncbi:MAG: hypothetical protein Q9160_003258 [Pyrenula sp. 1 TL-2023]
MMSSPLLRLPRELRNVIYSLLFSPEKILVYVGRDLKFHQQINAYAIPWDDPWPQHCQLLQVSKQIRAEASCWFWGRLTLNVDYESAGAGTLDIVKRIRRSKWRGNPGTIDLSVFRSIRIRIPRCSEQDLEMIGPDSFAAEISQDLEMMGFTNLRSLELIFVLNAMVKIRKSHGRHQHIWPKECRDGQINFDFGKVAIRHLSDKHHLPKIVDRLESRLKDPFFVRNRTPDESAGQQLVKMTAMKIDETLIDKYVVDDQWCPQAIFQPPLDDSRSISPGDLRDLPWSFPHY